MSEHTETKIKLPKRSPSSRHVLVISGGHAVTYELPWVGALTIGRAGSCEILLDDSGVSREHAVIRSGPQLYIEDLASRNGTKVGERALTPGEPALLAPGVVVQIGDAMIVVRETVNLTDDPRALSGLVPPGSGVVV